MAETDPLHSFLRKACLVANRTDLIPEDLRGWTPHAGPLTEPLSAISVDEIHSLPANYGPIVEALKVIGRIAQKLASGQLPPGGWQREMLTAARTIRETAGEIEGTRLAGLNWMDDDTQGPAPRLLEEPLPAATTAEQAVPSDPLAALETLLNQLWRDCDEHATAPPQERRTIRQRRLAARLRVDREVREAALAARAWCRRIGVPRPDAETLIRDIEDLARHLIRWRPGGPEADDEFAGLGERNRNTIQRVMEWHAYYAPYPTGPNQRPDSTLAVVVSPPSPPAAPEVQPPGPLAAEGKEGGPGSPVSPDAPAGLVNALPVSAPGLEALGLSNPYRQLADVFHALFWMAAVVRNKRTDPFDPSRINAVTAPWEAAESQARRASASRGIPFAGFDPTLTLAREIMHELVQVAAGNQTVPFHALDTRYTGIEQRLKELGMTYAGAEAASNPEERAKTGQGGETTPPGVPPPTRAAMAARTRRPRPGMTRDEANAKAIELGEADPTFVKKTLREWAEAIGCSDGLVPKLPLWIATMKKTGRGRKGRSPAPKVVSLTNGLEAVTGDGSPDEMLKRLVAESNADNKADPSPVADDQPGRPRKVRGGKRL
jgi:hypothetical protein